MIDKRLWRACQRIVYPKRFPSDNPPFPSEVCSVQRKRASWLYHTLAADPALLRQMRIPERLFS